MAVALERGPAGPPPGDIDLSEIIAAHPVRVMRLDAAMLRDLSSSALAVGDLLDACTVLDIGPEQLSPVLQAGGLEAAQAGLAVAWVIARRAFPALTWDEVRANYRVEVIDTGENPTPPGPGGNGPGTSSESPA